MVITCKKPCKRKRATMLTCEQMVDIALGTPEIGAVNFNVLHALIHVIVQQLNIQKCLVEFKGYDSERMEGILLSAKPGPILKLSEYMIDTGDGKPCPSRSKTLKKDFEETSEENDVLPPKKPPCECTGKKKKTEEDKEKPEKSKVESDGEDKKKQPKKIDFNEDECEEVEEPEPKKIREIPKKTCPCKEKETTPLIDEDVRAAASSYYGSDSEGACQTIVRIEPLGERCDSWRSRPALAHESMVKLEEKVAMLQDAFEALEQMPTNEELKKRAQGTACPATPVKDLWQIYNLNKRVESCEGTIEKLASMIEDLVKETCNLKEAMLVVADAVDEMECADAMAKITCCAAIQNQTGNPFAASSQIPQKSNKSNVSFLKDEVTATSSGKCNGQPCAEDKDKKASGGENADATDVAGTREEDGAPIEQPAPVENLPINPELDTSSGNQQIGIGPEFYKLSAAQKFCVLKESINCVMGQLKKMNDTLPLNQVAAKLCALVSMQKQLDAFEKEWRAFLETFGEEGIMGLHNTIMEFKAEFDNIHNVISKLIADKQDIEATIRNILQEIENIKKVKADLEIVEDLLAEKADASIVNRKVSHDQFDAACDDLTRGLDETLERLMQQEAMWNEAMDELHKEVDNKLDKNEIMPLKEFINKKLKCLQEKLKQLAQLRKDAEAAGAKSRILRNLNCIACDGDVIMKMDNLASYQCPPLPAQKNIKPMLTYELDQVRKAMKKGPCRGANHVEEAVADVQKKMAGIPLTQKEVVDSKISKLAHFCNRYCGGSHTITTPQQRITRIGHFLTEFGPQAMAMFNQDHYNPLCAIPSPPPPLAEEIDLHKPCV